MKYGFSGASLLALIGITASFLMLHASASEGESGSGRVHSGVTNSGTTTHSGNALSGTVQSGSSNSGVVQSGSTSTGNSHSGMSHSGMTRGERVSHCMRSIDRVQYRNEHAMIHDSYKDALKAIRSGSGLSESGTTSTGETHHGKGHEKHEKMEKIHEAVKEAQAQYRKDLRALLKKIYETRRACLSL